ncbi:MAG: transporter substrate-binding domain-containing protein [Lentisphaeraceae bacterium]|nr:transporter substrate-binding domain-containing protein [Lentisphaeraceae bacterium]
MKFTRYVAQLLILFCLLANFSCSSQSKTLRVGVSTNYPPVIFKEYGTVKGMEADFAYELANELGYKVEFVETEWNDILYSLNSGKVDIIMSGMSVTPTRSAQVSFATPIMDISQMLLIRRNEIGHFRKPGNGYYVNSNMKIGVSKGTTGEQLARKYLPKHRIALFHDVGSGAKALREGVIDCYIHDSPTIWSYAMKDDSELIGVYWKLSTEKVAWAIKRGNFALLNQVNAVLKKWRYSGKTSRIVSKWVPYKIEMK